MYYIMIHYILYYSSPLLAGRPGSRTEWGLLGAPLFGDTLFIRSLSYISKGI